MTSMFRRVLGVALAVALACSCSSDPPAATPPPAEVTFPANMLWGSASAGFQVESGNQTSDWGHWVTMPGKIKNGDKPDLGGPDALAHLDEDVKALKDSGQNAYRFSIEWSRVYPTRKAFDDDTPDQAAVDAYAQLLAKLRAAGITPMVTLSHFALPDWLADVTKPAELQGWEGPEIGDLFEQWCTRMGTRYGGDVDWWNTINEPLNLILGGYVQGSFPPGLILNMDRAFNAARAEARGHARCFDALHKVDTKDADGDGKAALVSYAAHLRTFHPLDPAEPEDTLAAERLRRVWNQWFMDAVIKGDWDDDLDGKFDGPKDKLADPTLIGRADYVAVNYYSDTLVSASRGILIPIVQAAVVQANMPTDRPKNDMGWDIYPEGLGTVMDEVAKYKLPVVITENGIADHADVSRARYIAEHLYQLGWARQRGVDVRGYFHWSLTDNFEWAEGFCPRFGLFSYDPQTKVRTMRKSADTYKAIAQSNKVRRADVDALPPYGKPTPCP
jgi:beta-glucosidase/6-phospho-beta-glucosidase/beta-galactosidase